MINKKLSTAILLTSLSFNCFGFGGVVTDPGSYSYYATQIEKAMEQLKVAEEQVKQATQTYNKVTNIDKNITGNLMRAQRNLERIRDMQVTSVKDIRKSLQYAKKALGEVSSLPAYVEEVETNIDKTFGVDPQSQNDWVNVKAQQRANKQKAYRQAIVDAEIAQGKIDIQNEQLEELALATNTSDSLKDATDITNAALLQVIENQQEMITLLANVSKNLSLAQYDGGEHANEAPNIINGKDITDANQWKNKKNLSSSVSKKDCNPFEEKCTKGTLFD